MRAKLKKKLLLLHEYGAFKNITEGRMVCLFFQSHLYYHPTVKSPIGFSSSLASLMNQLAGIFLTPDKLVFTFYVPQANGPQLKGSLLSFFLALIDFHFSITGRDSCTSHPALLQYYSLHILPIHSKNKNLSKMLLSTQHG